MRDSQVRWTSRHVIFFLLPATLLMTWAALLWLGWRSYGTSRRDISTTAHNVRLKDLREDILHCNEALTMSAHMGAATGDSKWEERYRSFEPKLAAAIKEAKRLFPEAHALEEESQGNEGHLQLSEMENRALALARAGQTDEAREVLSSDEYREQRHMYEQHVVHLTARHDGATILIGLRGTIARLDEVLTMSAHMAAATGEARWEELYRRFEPLLDDAIKEAASFVPDAGRIASTSATDEANIKLVSMENTAFELVRQDKADEAMALLTSDEYERQKQSYAAGMGALSKHIAATVKQHIDRDESHGFMTAAIVAVILPALSICWFVVLVAARRWQGAVVSKNVELAKQSRRLKENNRTLDRKVAARTAELARSNQELEEFTYLVSHDLQEPLRKVHSFGEFLVEDCSQSLSDEGMEHVRRMQSAAVRMKTLIEHLLDLARVGTRGGEFELVNPGQVVERVLDTLSRRIEETGATVDVDADMPVIIADIVQIEQLFQNLVSNALKFHAPEVSPHVRISAERANGSVKFRITDNGIGIEKRFHEKVLLPFQRLHRRDQYEGVGVGLALCAKIVRRHHGEMGIDSELAKGSEFWVTLPADGKGDQ